MHDGGGSGLGQRPRQHGTLAPRRARLRPAPWPVGGYRSGCGRSP